MKKTTMDSKEIEALAADCMEIPTKVYEMVLEKTGGSVERTIVNLEMVEIGLRMLTAELKNLNTKETAANA